MNKSKTSSTGRVWLILLAMALLGVVALLWSIGPSAPTKPQIKKTARAQTEAPVIEEDASAAQWPEDAPRTLVGTVRDVEGAPIEGVTVRAQRGETDLVVGETDAKGIYLLPRVELPIHRVIYTANSYQAHTLNRPKLPPGKRVVFDVVLKPYPGVRGRVTVQGVPTAGVRMTIYPPTDVIAERLMAAQRRRPIVSPKWDQCETDEQGRYSLPWLDEQWPDGGVNQVSASHPIHGKLNRDISEPGVVDLDLPGGGWLEVQVIDKDTSAPLTDFAITFGVPEDTRSVNDPAGRFKVGPLAPLTRLITVSAEGYCIKKTLAKIETGVVTEVEIRLKSARVLTGRITDRHTGKTIGGAELIGDSTFSMEHTPYFSGPDGRFSLPLCNTNLTVNAEGYKLLSLHKVTPERVKTITLAPLDEPSGWRGRESVGVGLSVILEGSIIVAAYLMPNSPASEKLKVGDVLIDSEGKPVSSSYLFEYGGRFLGEPGREVVMYVNRPGVGKKRIALKTALINWTQKTAVPY